MAFTSNQAHYSMRIRGCSPQKELPSSKDAQVAFHESHTKFGNTDVSHQQSWNRTAANQLNPVHSLLDTVRPPD